MSKKLTQKQIIKAAKYLDPVRCNSGHESDLALWNCPVCTDHHVKENVHLIIERDRLKELNERLVETLLFYADGKNHCSIDGGLMARSTLAAFTATTTLANAEASDE